MAAASEVHSGDPVVEVHHLCKRFADVQAVEALTFQVYRGEIFGLLGPNGAGKTTTIQMLLGLITPTCGSIRILGLDLHSHRRAILQRVNFSSSYVQLPFNLTVWENLYIFARLYGVPNPRQKIRALLEWFEIPEVLHRRAGVLSSGQLTRLNLCKALLNDPEILFVDEPTASLDPDMAEKVRTILKRVRAERGTTIVYTSHNMFEVEQLCDRVLFLMRGRMVTVGTPQQIIRQAGTRTLEEFFIRLAREQEPTPVR